MSDLDSVADSNNHEKMEKPTSAKNNNMVLFGFGAAIVVLFLFAIFQSDGDSDNALNVDEQTVIEAEKYESPSTKQLVMPESKEPSISEQLNNDKYNNDNISDDESVANSLKNYQKEPATNGVVANEMLALKELILMQEQARIEKELEKSKKADDYWALRRQASMSDSGGRSANRNNTNGVDYGVDQKRAEIERARQQVQSMQEMIENKKNSNSGALENLSFLRSGSGSGSNSNDAPYKELLTLPQSTTRTISAGVLENLEWLLTEGTIIHATIESKIVSTLPTKIRAITTLPVYSYTGNTIVIPSGSELIGQYSAAEQAGDPRLFVIWTRLITPDGISVNLDSQGIDQLGVGGLAGRTNTHFMKRFGSSILLSIIGGITQQQADNNNQVQSISDSFNKTAEIALQSSINIAPTIERNQGASVAVFVNSDVDFSSAMQASSLAKNRLDNEYGRNKQTQPISYDRVFDTRDLSHEERALLANRFIADDRLRNNNANSTKPYVAKSGDGLRSTIKNWSSLAGYKLVWDVKDLRGNTIDWKLPTDITMHDSLYESVGRLLDAYRSTGVPLVYKFFNENNVLTVQMGEGFNE